jgi:hypothetical protein
MAPRRAARGVKVGIESNDARSTRATSFAGRARRLQERWRVEHGWPGGKHPGWLRMPDAAHELWNYLTPGIGTLVKTEVERNRLVRDVRSRKLYAEPRLFDNMLSSQPMCFNLLGELALDADLATSVFKRLFPERVVEVQEIRFEYSPGRRDPRYLNNRSAADAFVVHTTPNGGRGFIAIETKYCEDMSASPGTWDHERYDKVAQWAAAWTAGQPPTTGRLLQVTLDHLLALSMLRAADGWETGLFVFLYPAENNACTEIAATYEERLNEAGRATYRSMTLEDVHHATRRSTRKPWVDDFRRRYLDFASLD